MRSTIDISSKALTAPIEATTFLHGFNLRIRNSVPKEDCRSAPYIRETGF